MALRIDASSEHAHAPNPWASGEFTFAFWMYRINGVATSRFLCGLLDTDDAAPETGAPRVNVNTASAQNILAQHHSSAAVSDSSSLTYASGGWTHVAVRYTGSGVSLSGVEVFINGVGTGSPGTGTQDMTLNGAFDRLQIGSNTTSFSNADFAHWAYFGSALTGDQITELQTKLPTAVTGASPLVYYPLITDVANAGTGGATYDLTLSGAALNSTNDGTLPALSGPGAASVTSDLAGSYSVLGAVQVDLVGGYDIESAGSVQTDLAGSYSVLGAAQSDLAGSYAIESAGAVRLQFGVMRERGAFYASATGIKYWVFRPDNTVEASGTSLSLDSNGVGYVDLATSPFAVGDNVLVGCMKETTEPSPLDRTIYSGLFYVPAIAIP